MISILKLVSSLCYKLIFVANKCLMRETNNQKMIGLVDVNDDLYKLKTKFIPNANPPLSIHLNSVNSYNKVSVDL